MWTLILSLVISNPGYNAVTSSLTNVPNFTSIESCETAGKKAITNWRVEYGHNSHVTYTCVEVK